MRCNHCGTVDWAVVWKSWKWLGRNLLTVFVDVTTWLVTAPWWMCCLTTKWAQMTHGGGNGWMYERTNYAQVCWRPYVTGVIQSRIRQRTIQIDRLTENQGCTGFSSCFIPMTRHQTTEVYVTYGEIKRKPRPLWHRSSALSVLSTFANLCSRKMPHILAFFGPLCRTQWFMAGADFLFQPTLVFGKGATFQPPAFIQSGTKKSCSFFNWPVGSGSKSESIFIDPHVKMSNFTAQINMFTAWFKNWFWSPQQDFTAMKIILGGNFYVRHQVELYKVTNVCIVTDVVL